MTYKDHDICLKPLHSKDDDDSDDEEEGLDILINEQNLPPFIVGVLWFFCLVFSLLGSVFGFILINKIGFGSVKLLLKGCHLFIEKVFLNQVKYYKFGVMNNIILFLEIYSFATFLIFLFVWIFKSYFFKETKKQEPKKDEQSLSQSIKKTAEIFTKNSGKKIKVIFMFAFIPIQMYAVWNCGFYYIIGGLLQNSDFK